LPKNSNGGCGAAGHAGKCVILLVKEYERRDEGGMGGKGTSKSFPKKHIRTSGLLKQDEKTRGGRDANGQTQPLVRKSGQIRTLPSKARKVGPGKCGNL